MGHLPISVKGPVELTPEKLAEKRRKWNAYMREYRHKRKSNPKPPEDVKKSEARKLRMLQRRTEAVEMRAAGASYREIGAALKMDYTTAQQIVYREMARQRRQLDEGVETIRQIELARLDKMHFGVWAKALDGDEKAIDRVLAIMRERRELIPGLTAPKQVNHDVDVLVRKYVGVNVEQI